MKFQILNNEELGFFDSNGVKKATMKISGSNLIIDPIDNGGNIIMGEGETVNDLELGIASTPVNMTFLGGGTISPNGGTLHIGNGSSSDSVILSGVTISSSVNFPSGITGSFQGTHTGTFIGNGSQITGVTATQSPGGGDKTVQFNDGNTDTSGNDNFTFNKTTNVVKITGSLNVSGSSSADYFFGDGSGLTNIIGAFPFTGSAGISGSLDVNGNVTATTFYGDGSNITGVTSTFAPTGQDKSLQFNKGGTSISGSDGILFDYNTDSLHVAQAITASTFVGDGSQLTNGAWGGTFSGSANLTGSLHILQSTGSTPSLLISGSTTSNTDYSFVTQNSEGFNTLRVRNNRDVLIGEGFSTDGSTSGYANLIFPSTYILGGNINIGDNFTNASAGQNTVRIGVSAGGSAQVNKFIAIGDSAGAMAKGSNNIMMGFRTAWGFGRAGNANNNVVIGHFAGSGNQNHTGAHDNTIIGDYAALTIGGGAYNTILGSRAGYSINSGDYNTLIGYHAGYNMTGSNNVIIGSEAGYNLNASNQLRISNTGSEALITGDFANKEVHIYDTLKLGVKNSATENAGSLTISGKSNDATKKPTLILDGGWHGAADKLQIQIGDHSPYGPTYRSIQHKFATANGDNILNLGSHPSGNPGVNLGSGILNLSPSGGGSALGVKLRTAHNLETYQHTSFLYDWLDWTGTASNQGYIFHTYSHKNLLVLEGTNGRVGIGTTSPSAMLHVTGTISASAYHGDGSSLTGIASFPYTGSADISGSMQINGSGSTLFDVVGSQGQLFSITDSLTGSLFAVSDVSGLPILEVFSDDTIKMGSFNNEALEVSGSDVNFNNLPTSDPGVSGRLFKTGSDAIGATAGFQVVCISQG